MYILTIVLWRWTLLNPEERLCLYDLFYTKKSTTEKKPSLKSPEVDFIAQKFTIKQLFTNTVVYLPSRSIEIRGTIGSPPIFLHILWNADGLQPVSLLAISSFELILFLVVFESMASWKTFQTSGYDYTALWSSVCGCEPTKFSETTTYCTSV